MTDDSVTILIVDDSRDILEVLDWTLEDRYTVLCTDDPHEALSLVDHHVVRVLLSDVVMPIMSGIELARRVVAKHPAIKVLMMTGFSTQPIEYPLLRKPFRLDELLTKLNELLCNTAPNIV